MTDWGAHHFDIAQWGLGMDHTGPVEVIPPDGKDYKHLTYKYANGVEMRHILYGPCVTFIGTKGKISLIGVTGESRFEPEEIGRECTYTDISHMKQPASIASRFPTMLETSADVFKFGFAVTSPL